jgi:hypothetical protein
MSEGSRSFTYLILKLLFEPGDKVAANATPPAFAAPPLSSPASKPSAHRFFAAFTEKGESPLKKGRQIPIAFSKRRHPPQTRSPAPPGEEASVFSRSPVAPSASAMARLASDLGFPPRLSSRCEFHGGENND